MAVNNASIDAWLASDAVGSTSNTSYLFLAHCGQSIRGTAASGTAGRRTVTTDADAAAVTAAMRDRISARGGVGQLSNMHFGVQCVEKQVAASGTSFGVGGGLEAWLADWSTPFTVITVGTGADAVNVSRLDGQYEACAWSVGAG